MACNIDMLRTIAEDKKSNFGSIAAIQEPNIDKKSGIITRFPNNNMIYHREANRNTPTRAAIYYTSDVDIQPLFEFTGPDIATGNLTVSTDDKKENIILTSVYMDYENPLVWPKALTKLLQGYAGPQRRGIEFP